MELRFVKGNFEHGKFKLQYRKITGYGADHLWVDVPCVKQERESFWCPHITFDLNYEKNKRKWYVGGGWGLWATDETMFCPICGAEKPKSALSKKEMK